MPQTWLQFKTDLRTLLSDITASDDLFAFAVASYVKAYISREVDHDLLLSKSYLSTFMDMRRRLLGYQTALVPGSTLDTAVAVLLPTDYVREGLSAYIAQMIKNGYQEIYTQNTFIEKMTREALIDLQSYIQCYRTEKETLYTDSLTIVWPDADVAVVANMSRGPIPDQAEFIDGYHIQDNPVLIENVAFKCGDFVASNGRTYVVVTGGSLGTGELGAGLVTTDKSIERLGGMAFIYYSGEAFLRSKLVQYPWENRFNLSKLPDGFRGKNYPAYIMMDQEAYSFYVWPKLDDTHSVIITWNGLKFDFLDSDFVPFDESAEQAVKEYVLSRYYLQVEQDAGQAKSHGETYVGLRSRLFADCAARQRITW